MSTKLSILLIVSVMTVFGVMVVPDTSAQSNHVTVTPINEKISLEETITTMYVPENNKLPWGSVKGEADDIAERYPVIIQFYKGEDPVHFAQVDVKGDGSYEYKFRVRNVDATTGEAINIFEGKYIVKIYKVIPNIDTLA
ncbi:MAG: hypothetical protein OEL56_04040 [Nitrosopumilus sp.]|nr:hypothetical protein [Nitrosopumilus sp.]MDH3489598.1 hypothetical protein [Nitrosopumilus sp.]MDH3516596.1 hypothetical protein [Nitrosopumilus sp.]MDH3565063.1 hypothetical protein [Nitrosopumilus sp.]MDH5416486.1 hypothetical protein [Nitrosopumilus sp.]